MVTIPAMGKVLDRLAKRLWIPWLACVSLGAASVVLDATGYGLIAFVLSLAVGSAMLAVLFEYLGWYSRAREALGPTGLRELRSTRRNWAFLAFIFLSILAIGAVYVFDLPRDLIMPLVASAMIPLYLKDRSALVACLASPQAAG